MDKSLQLNMPRRGRDSWSSALIESMAHGLFVHDRAGVIVDVNAMACDMLGYTREELTCGMSVCDIDPSITLDSLNGMWSRMVPGHPVSIEATHRRKDGTHLPVEVNIHLVASGDQDLIVATTRDITQQHIIHAQQKELNHRLREAHQHALLANRTKGRFLANMSHELRTPLNAIIGYAELIHEELEDAQHLRDLSAILLSSNHLLSLINDLLDLSKLEEGHTRLTLEQTLLEPLILSVAAQFEPLCKQKQNTLCVHPQERVSAYTDARKVTQVLLNLLSNANKFTQGGRIELDLTHTQHSFIIRVRDNGAGIDPGHHERLFAPFEQVDDQGSGLHKGTGLGLALCRSYAELLGGTLTVQSALGEGATFTLTLPLTSSPAPYTPSPLLHGADAVDRDHLPMCISLELFTGVAKLASEHGLNGKPVHTTHDLIAATRALNPALLLVEYSEEFDQVLAATHRIKTTPTTSASRLVPLLYSHAQHRGLALTVHDLLCAPFEDNTLRATILRHLSLEDTRHIIAHALPRATAARFPADAQHTHTEDALHDLLQQADAPKVVFFDFDFRDIEGLAAWHGSREKLAGHTVILVLGEQPDAQQAWRTINAAIAMWGKDSGALGEELGALFSQLAASQGG